jgi:hypothetical protein
MALIRKNKKNIKTSKGYRLKVSTHKLIDKMQFMLEADQDKVITKACRLLYNELKKNVKL